MQRRDFLKTMLAACAAPAIVRADALMRVVPVETPVLTLAYLASEFDEYLVHSFYTKDAMGLWVMQRQVYTRGGVALQLQVAERVVNLPFREIQAAALRPYPPM